MAFLAFALLASLTKQDGEGRVGTDGGFRMRLDAGPTCVARLWSANSRGEPA